MDNIVSIAGTILAFCVCAYLLYIVFKEIFLRRKSMPDSSITVSGRAFRSISLFPVITAICVLGVMFALSSIVLKYFGNAGGEYGFIGAGSAGLVLSGEGFMPSPLMALLLKLFSMISVPLEVTGCFVAFLSAVASAQVLYLIATKLYSKEVAQKAVTFYVLAPFAVLYTIPTYYSILLLGILFLYYASLYENKILLILTGILAVFMSPLSILILPALLIDNYNKNALPCLVMAIAVFVETTILKVVFGAVPVRLYNGLSELFNNQTPYAILFRSVPTLIFILAILLYLILNKKQLSKGLRLYLLLLAVLPLVVENIYAAVATLAFPLFLGCALGRHFTIKTTFAAIICGLTFCCHCIYLLY